MLDWVPGLAVVVTLVLWVIGVVLTRKLRVERHRAQTALDCALQYQREKADAMAYAMGVDGAARGLLCRLLLTKTDPRTCSAETLAQLKNAPEDIKNLRRLLYLSSLDALRNDEIVALHVLRVKYRELFTQEYDHGTGGAAGTDGAGGVAGDGDAGAGREGQAGPRPECLVS